MTHSVHAESVHDEPVREPAPVVPAAVWGSALGLSALATSFVARLPSFPIVAALVFVSVALTRLTAGRSGLALVPAWTLRSLQIAGIAAGTAWMFHHLGTGPALAGLLLVTVAVQAFLLIPRQTAFVVFLQILFSSTSAVGTAFLAKDTPALVLAVAYVFALAWTLLLYERGAALSQAESPHGAVRRLRAEGGSDLPVRPLLRVITKFLLLGFPLGLLMYAGVPRTWDWMDADQDEAPKRRPGGEDSRAGGSAGTRITAIQGPALKGRSGAATLVFNTVAEIQRDLTPYFEVREVDRSRPPVGVILREDTRDLCLPNGDWMPSDQSRRPYACDASGKVDMGGRDDPATGRTLQIVSLYGGHRRLFLEPNGVAFRVRRGGRALQQYLCVRTAAEMWELPKDIEKGDVIVQRSVPVRHTDAELSGRRSDSAVSPRLSYLQVPDNMRQAVGALARQVVGGETDPWKRARLVEAWLKSDEFVYALRPPPVDPDHIVVDFLTRTKTGFCEHFAQALTLMIRTLGHPARYARGFWGGDRLDERGSVLLRLSHYHAWCEMYLDGIGWVPLNPTPPDRRAIDADTETVESRKGGEDGASFSFLGLNSKNWSSFWQAIGGWIHDHILGPLGALFARAPLVFGALLIGLLAWAFFRSGWRTRTTTEHGARKRSVAPGVYGEALRLLAAQGTRRRRSHTLREFETFAVAKHPDIAHDLGTLTRLREQERYAGRVGPDAQALAQQALARIRTTLHPA